MILRLHSVMNTCINLLVMVLIIFLLTQDFYAFTHHYIEHIRSINAHKFTNGIYTLKFPYLYSRPTIHPSP